MSEGELSLLTCFERLLFVAPRTCRLILYLSGISDEISDMLRLIFSRLLLMDSKVFAK